MIRFSEEKRRNKTTNTSLESDGRSSPILNFLFRHEMRPKNSGKLLINIFNIMEGVRGAHCTLVMPYCFYFVLIQGTVLLAKVILFA